MGERTPTTTSSKNLIKCRICFYNFHDSLFSLFCLFFFAPIISSQHSNLIRCRYHIVIVSAASLDDAKMSIEQMKEEKSFLSFRIPITPRAEHIQYQLHRTIMCVWAAKKVVRHSFYGVGKRGEVERNSLCPQTIHDSKSKSSNIRWNCCRKEILITFDIICLLWEKDRAWVECDQARKLSVVWTTCEIP